MRTLPLSLIAIAATASLAFTVAPAAQTAPDLETVPYAVTDAAGDANASNGQGFQDVDSVSTDPAQIATADILGGRVTSLFEAVEGADGLLDYVVTGLEFRTALSAEPTDTSAPVLYRFNVSAGGCPIFIQAYGGANGSAASFRLNGASCGIDDPALSFETLSGNWISSSWDAEHGELVVSVEFEGADPRVAELLPTEGYLQIDGLESRGNNVFVVAPVYDITDSGYAFIGEDVPADEEPAEDGEPTSDPSPTSSPSPTAG